MTDYEQVIKKHKDRINLYTISLLAIGMMLVGISLPTLVAYAQTPPDPLDRFAQLQGIITTAFILIGAAMGIIAKYLRKYGLGTGATATMVQTFAQKTVENVGDITVLMKILNTTTGGKVQQELDKQGANINLFDEKLQVGKEQFDILKEILLKYLGEKVDPNTKELPRESQKVVNVFPKAEARSTGGEPLN